MAGAAEKKVSENIILDKIGELCGKLDAHHFEVTRQLKYQEEKIKNEFKWHPEYSNKYLEVA